MANIRSVNRRHQRAIVNSHPRKVELLAKPIVAVPVAPQA